MFFCCANANGSVSARPIRQQTAYLDLQEAQAMPQPLPLTVPEGALVEDPAALTRELPLLLAVSLACITTRQQGLEAVALPPCITAPSNLQFGETS